MFTQNHHMLGEDSLAERGQDGAEGGELAEDCHSGIFIQLLWMV